MPKVTPAARSRLQTQAAHPLDVMIPEPPRRRRLLRGPEIWSSPGAPGRLPISRATWLTGVRDGHFPQPVRLGKNVVAWREADIEKIEEEGTENT
jgi:predicted DNA-binding transcriptional regulator AlpA